MYQQHDVSISKHVQLVGRSNIEFRLEMLNALNHANFLPVGGLGSNIASYEVTALTGTNTSRIIQLVTRINW
jgi:hypothetical protein